VRRRLPARPGSLPKPQALRRSTAFRLANRYSTPPPRSYAPLQHAVSTHHARRVVSCALGQPLPLHEDQSVPHRQRPRRFRGQQQALLGSGFHQQYLPFPCIRRHRQYWFHPPTLPAHHTGYPTGWGSSMSFLPPGSADAWQNGLSGQS